MSSGGKTRQRCTNFSREEKLLIANICGKYKHIIENKKTDHVSNEEKNKIWEKIAAEVNATAVNTTYRTSEVLKRFYENRKREVRKMAAEEKKEIFATGGGPNKHFKKDVCHDIILSIMSSKTVYGLDNKFGGDVEPTVPTQSKDRRSSLEESNSSENVDHTKKYQLCDDDEDYVDFTGDIVYELSGDEQTEAKWKKYVPADLKQPVTSNLKNFENNSSKRRNNDEETNDSTIVTPKTKTSKSLPASRRRPTVQVKALTRSEIAEKYDQLLDRRLEIAEFQKKKLTEELLSIEGERNLKFQLLELQIKVEKEKLNKFQNQC